MNQHTTWLLVVLGLVGAGSGPRIASSAAALQEDGSRFSRTTIDVGVVVSDLEESAAFYGKVLGFEELDGFSVGGDFCRDAGLTNEKPLTIRVFALGKGPEATKIKLMAVRDVETAAGNNAFVHSQLGLRYLTVFVTNTNAALARLEQAGIKPLAKGPILIGEDPAGSYLTVVRDPDGNMVELIGPKL